jgi:ribosome-associated heat shock protein Hsp15
VSEKSPPNSDESVRVDLWAWSVRLFKSRSLAGSACRNAKLLVNDQRCRASRPVRVGDVVTVRQGELQRTLEVAGLLRRRVGAAEVGAFLRDLTPSEEYERVAELARLARESRPWRDRGLGRPTKRDRREVDSLRESVPEDPVG